MHDKDAATRVKKRAHKVTHKTVRILFIDADAVLDGDVDIDGVTHRLKAVSDELGFEHEARAETAPLHALRGTAAVKVHFVVAAFGNPLCGLREFRGVTPPQLTGNGVFNL